MPMESMRTSSKYFHSENGKGDGVSVGLFLGKQRNLTEEIAQREFVKQLSINSKASSQPVCRICLSEDEIDNPLIAPCACSGSMKYIHAFCLQTWLSSRVTTKNTNYSISFTLKNFECELCKATIPRMSFSLGFRCEEETKLVHRVLGGSSFVSNKRQELFVD